MEQPVDRGQLDDKAAAWLSKLPAFVEAVTVSGDNFMVGSGVPFDPGVWEIGQSLGGWTVMAVTETSVRFRRNDVLLDEAAPPS